ncbi:MAG: TetR/AcrR family transcriptional regulator [Pseudomonadota bacterium]
MTDRLAIVPSEKALSQLPRMPVRADGKATYDKVLDAVDAFLRDNDPDEISLNEMAEKTSLPVASVYHLFPNPEAAAAALTMRYVERAADEIMSKQSATTAEGWQGVVYQIFHRGRAFYAKYPAAMKLRLGSSQSAGVRHVILQSTWRLAEIIVSELERLFRMPNTTGLVDELAYAIIISDALWSLSIELHGEITDDMAEQAEQAVSALLEPLFGTTLPVRA